MSEKMSPKDLVSLLNHYLGEMTEILQKHSGTIIEFIGDGILAIFGAPVESKNNAEQAVAAAVEMQMKMDEINRWNETNGYPILEMGIGINTGEVIVGNIGSEKRTKYGVCGSNVNLCGRIESYTTGGQIIISPLTKGGQSGRKPLYRQIYLLCMIITEKREPKALKISANGSLFSSDFFTCISHPRPRSHWRPHPRCCFL